MATLTQQNVSSPAPEMTASEIALCDAFDDLLETLPAESREGLIRDLRANAIAHGE